MGVNRLTAILKKRDLELGGRRRDASLASSRIKEVHERPNLGEAKVDREEGGFQALALLLRHLKKKARASDGLTSSQERLGTRT